MHPTAAVTEFLYAHVYADKSHLWYAAMLGTFADFCTAATNCHAVRA